MFENYEKEKVAPTSLGEHNIHLLRDYAAFVAGVEYALDQLLNADNYAANHANFGPCMSAELSEAIGIDTLRKAKAGQPQ